MSTSYYRLQEPFSSVRLEEGPGHDRVTLWESGANIGTLTVSRGMGRDVVLRFADTDADTPPMRTHWGGAEAGTVVTDNHRLAPDVVLVSEYGEVMTVEQVRQRQGAKRSDGWPTELMGFEDSAAEQPDRLHSRGTNPQEGGRS